MRLQSWRGVVILLPLLVILGAFGCAKKPKPAITPPPETTTTTTIPKTEEPAHPSDTVPSTVAASLQDIFFDYDRYNLREDGRTALSTNGKLLTDNPAMKLLLEGHCDERGTVEYNLALGERRATAAKSYLVQYGVNPSRLSTISYGEERPFSQGHDESAWSQNRRVHFVKQ